MMKSFSPDAVETNDESFKLTEFSSVVIAVIVVVAAAAAAVVDVVSVVEFVPEVLELLKSLMVVSVSLEFWCKHVKTFFFPL